MREPPYFGPGAEVQVGLLRSEPASPSSLIAGVEINNCLVTNLQLVYCMLLHD